MKHQKAITEKLKILFPNFSILDLIGSIFNLSVFVWLLSMNDITCWADEPQLWIFMKLAKYYGLFKNDVPVLDGDNNKIFNRCFHQVDITII